MTTITPSPEVTIASADADSIGITICGSSMGSYTHILAKLIRGQQNGSSNEVKLAKNITLLEGKSTWLLWRSKVASALTPHLEGRLWYLIHGHPATSVEAYRKIFATTDGKPIDVDEAKAYRDTDLTQAGSVLVNTLGTKTSQDVASHVTGDGIDGQAVWQTLFRRYSGKDMASQQAAELNLAVYSLGDKTVQDVTQDLELLFSQIFMSSGDPVNETRKIGVALRIFTNTRFDSLRATIQNSWQNGQKYTFDEVMSRFSGEESLRPLAASTAAGSTVADGARAFRVEQGPSANHRSQNQATRGGNRTNNNRRQGGNSARTASKCWWCDIVGHRVQVCSRRLAGHPPNPNGQVARERSGQTQTYGSHSLEHSSPAAMNARLALLENSYLQASALYAGPGSQHRPHAAPVMHHNGVGSFPSSHGHYHHPPALANRISELPVQQPAAYTLAQRLGDFGEGASFGNTH
ncbi:hypothetical protein A4X13_0g8123 [Tilletia indica]|uniref:Uncharacterized protein n=1 Tax=Tilletia indica TaxID=43049 RepID=A0A8T8SG97_9BASI|nr:hypothetical protein A4X13_0g8123 [Tilletia indica]